MNNFKYIFMILLGGILYGTMSSFVKLSYKYGYTAAEISFAQAALAAVFLGVIAVKNAKSDPLKISKKELYQLILTGGAIGLTNFLYYLSVSYISASLAIVILMQFTWFSLALEWILFRNRPSRIEFLTVFLILIGTVMAGNLLGTEALSYSLTGIALVLFASFSYAAYIVANGRIGKNVGWPTKSTLIMVGSAVAIFLINGKSILFENHFGADFLLWALFFAIIGTTIPTALFAAGIPKVGAGISSILMTVELPMAVLCASLVLGEEVGLIQSVGIALMLGAIAAMNYFKTKVSPKKEMP